MCPPAPPSLQWLSVQAFEYLVQLLIYSEVVAPALISTEGALSSLMISIQSHPPTKPLVLHSYQIILFVKGVSKKVADGIMGPLIITKVGCCGS